ncbi:hypothetical protein FI667_g6617, partial [Globisporangium splendens]
MVRSVYPFIASLIEKRSLSLSVRILLWVHLFRFTTDLGDSETSGFSNGDRDWTAILCVLFWVWLAIKLTIMQITTPLLVADFAGERQVLGASIDQGWFILGSLYVSRHITIAGYPLGSTHEYMAMASIAVLIAVAVACVVANESPKVNVENPLSFRVVAYLLTWAFPFTVERFGAKGVVAASTVPQTLLVIAAFVTKPMIVTQIAVVLITLSFRLVFVLVVPLIVHLMGSSDTDIGVYLGVMSTTGSFVSLFHYTVETAAGYDASSLEYMLPILIGSLAAVVGFSIWVFFFQVKMHAK